MKSSSKIYTPRRGFLTSWFIALLSLIFLALLYTIIVYVLPIKIDPNLDNSFDAFSYAYAINDDPSLAQEQQRFLILYPYLSVEWLFLYAPLLNFAFLTPSLFLMRKYVGRQSFYILLACLALPESLIFVSGISKEGLGIAAAISVSVGLTLLAQGEKRVTGILMCILGVIIAELSRPFFGAVFVFAVLLGALPLSSGFSRKLVLLLGFIFIGFLFWASLLGPFSNDFTLAYQSAREFVNWFESEMGSDSFLKSAMRQFFSAAFASNEPTLSTILLILFAGLFKTIVYLFAVPLISPPNFTTMPAQVWAVTWQVAVSLSSLFTGMGIWRLRIKTALTLEDKCRLSFAFGLIFIIAISTAIFHVRYRAPGVIVLLLALWMAIPMRKMRIPWPAFFALATSTFAFISVS